MAVSQSALAPWLQADNILNCRNYRLVFIRKFVQRVLVRKGLIKAYFDQMREISYEKKI